MGCRVSELRCRFGVVWALLVVALAGGCAPAPLRLTELDEPPLRAIHDAFGEAVDAARCHPDLEWHSGWFGNALVNLGGSQSRGLCHHWQAWVYREVAPAVRDVGWEACGIGINVGTSGEHHAVVVYDPGRLAEDELLKVAATDPAYVLDAWRRGRADIYRLSDWLALPVFVLVPPRLEALPDGEGSSEEEKLLRPE